MAAISGDPPSQHEVPDEEDRGRQDRDRDRPHHYSCRGSDQPYEPFDEIHACNHYADPGQYGDEVVEDLVKAQPSPRFGYRVVPDRVAVNRLVAVCTHRRRGLALSITVVGRLSGGAVRGRRASRRSILPGARQTPRRAKGSDDDLDRSVRRMDFYKSKEF